MDSDSEADGVAASAEEVSSTVSFSESDEIEKSSAVLGGALVPCACAVSVLDLCCMLPHPVRQQHRRTAQDNRKNRFFNFNLLYDKYYCSHCIIIIFQIGKIQIKLRFQKGKYNVKNSRRLHNHFDCDRLQEKEYHS